MKRGMLSEFPGKFPKQLCQSDLPFRVCSATRTFRTFLSHYRAASERKEPSLFRTRARARKLSLVAFKILRVSNFQIRRFGMSRFSAAKQVAFTTFLHIYRRQQRRPSNSAGSFHPSPAYTRIVREGRTGLYMRLHSCIGRDERVPYTSNCHLHKFD